MPGDTPANVDTAMAELKELVGADGGDIMLLSREGATMNLRLVLDSAECRECVMPRVFLEQIALDKFIAADASIETVLIDDPREPV